MLPLISVYLSISSLCLLAQTGAIAYADIFFFFSFGMHARQWLQGTPLYMSPEQIDEGQPITPAADMWSLGVMVLSFSFLSVLWYDRPVRCVIW
jgi:serine/threonine protein kinase